MVVVLDCANGVKLILPSTFSRDLKSLTMFKPDVFVLSFLGKRNDGFWSLIILYTWNIDRGRDLIYIYIYVYEYYQEIYNR